MGLVMNKETKINLISTNFVEKTELEDYATKEDLGDQFTMEFDSSTKTLTIIKK